MASEAAAPEGGCLFAAALGAAWQTVDPRLRRFHGAARGEGVCRLEWGKGMGWLARCLRFPSPGAALPVRLAVRRAKGTEVEEVWERRFGAGALRSTMRVRGDLLVERYGPAEILLRPSVRDGALLLASAGASLRWGPLRLPLPRWLGPEIEGYDVPGADPETTHFSVRITFFGRELMAYEGDLRVSPEIGEDA